MERSLSTVVWAGVAAALIGFFLPWATLDLKTTEGERQIAASARRSLGKTFKSVGRSPSRQPSWIRSKKAAPVIPTRVSGYQIPQYANRKNVKVAMALVELATKQREEIGFKSYAVYLVPGVALVCGLLIVRGRERTWVAAGVALACGAVAIAGLWILLTTDTRAKYAMAIGPGLWLSLAGYAVLALAAASAVFQPQTESVARRVP